MLALEGIYQNNQLILNQKISFSKPVKVIVTFLEESIKEPPQKTGISQFSIEESKAVSNEVRGLSSDAMIEEQGLSLISAMQGMEEEESLYTHADIKVQFT